MTRSIERDDERLSAWAGTTRNTRRPALPYYVIGRYGAQGLELLHIPLGSGAETLPVFSSEKLARDFLLSSALEPGWYARESYTGELVSLLLGLCASVEWVLIDPLSEHQAAEGNHANIAHWESFVDHLSGAKHRRFPTSPRKRVLAAAAPGIGSPFPGRAGLSSS